MLQDKYITVNSRKIRYWQSGDSGPHILLVHGIAASCEYWMYNVEELSKYFKVYAVDMVGFGKSSKPKMDFTAENFAKFLYDFLKAQNINKAHLVGHSLGGAVCLQFAIDYPKCIGKLVLVDSAGFGQEIPFGFRILTVPVLGKFLLQFDQRKFLAQALRAYAFNREAITDEFIDRMQAVLSLRGAKRTMLAILRQHASIFGVRRQTVDAFMDNLHKIKAQTLVVWGRQDRLLSLKHAQVAVRNIPNAKLHVFDQCGHVPQIEVSGKFNKLLNNFLRE